MKKNICFLLATNFLMLCAYSQNVGIGTGTPTRAKLEVNGAVDATSAIFGGESSGISLQRSWPGIGFNSYWNTGDRYLATGFAAKLHMDPGTGLMYFDMLSNGSNGQASTGFKRALTLHQAGWIGIAGGYPNSELQLPNTLNNRKITLWESANNNSNYFGFGIQPGTLTYNVGSSGDWHRFYCGNAGTPSTQLMAIGGNKKVVMGTQAGTTRVGINSADPMYALEVVQADHTGIVIVDPNTWNHWELKTEQVGSNGNYLFFRYNGGGGPFIQPDGSYHSASDYRLKDDIQPMPDLLHKLTQLKASSYVMKFNNTARRKTVGFIAQDVEKLFPELVSVVDGPTAGYKSIPDLHTINYTGLSVIAIKAIQEQQQQIEAMKKENSELKNEVLIIKQQLEELKQLVRSKI